MKPSITKITLFLIPFALGFFALCPLARAVNPPPDGGYPGFNTAEGQNALFSLTTGAANTAVGWFSLFSNAGGSFNTATGVGALLFNTADENTAFGAVALLSNTTGSFNTAAGVNALSSNTEGVSNNAFGWGALLLNTTGTNNTAIGVRALESNTEGDANIAVGERALASNTTSSSNTAVGLFALASNTTGNNNTAIGQGAGQAITGNNNICIGQGVFGVAGENNTIRIGDNLAGGATHVGNIWNVGPGVPNTPVLVSDTGRLGVNTSSRRFKQDIKPMEKASEAILSLKPVTFHYKNDAKNTPCFGLIAEEVAEVDPTLVIRDEKGQPFTVRYEQINGMLLNEFLKEHKRVQEQQATIAELKKELGTVVAQLKEQAAQIQKVSALVEMSRPAPHVVVNSP